MKEQVPSHILPHLWRGAPLLILLFALIASISQAPALAGAGNVVVAPSAQAGCTNVVIVYADTAAPTGLQSEIMAEPGVTAVDLFDAHTATPTLAFLSNYKIVVPFSSSLFADSLTLGNNLADYVDGGGIVVQYGISFYGPAASLGINGRWITGGYNPYNYSTTILGPTPFTLGTFTCHPLMAGVGTLNSNSQNVVTLATGAIEVAAASNGNSLVAYRPVSGGHTTVGATAYVGANATQNGHWGRVIVNAGNWLGGGCGPTVVRAVSRLIHHDSAGNSAGAFDIPLPLDCPTGVECRRGDGVNHDVYTMVVTFNQTVTTSPTAVVTCHTGNIIPGVGGVTVCDADVIVQLTGVANAQNITVQISGVNLLPTVDIPMGILIGDINGNRAVNAADVALCKTIVSIGFPVTPTNFRADVNVDGHFGSSDISLVKQKTGFGITPCCP